MTNAIDISTLISVSIPVTVAIFLTWWEYRRNRADTRRRLRTAFLTEIGYTREFLSSFPWEDTGVVPSFKVSTAVYESAGGSLGILTDYEVMLLSKYYMFAQNVAWELENIEKGRLSHQSVSSNATKLAQVAEKVIEVIEDSSDLDYDDFALSVDTKVARVEQIEE